MLREAAPQIEKTPADMRRAGVWCALSYRLYDSAKLPAYSLYDTRRSTEAPVLLVVVIEPA